MCDFCGPTTEKNPVVTQHYSVCHECICSLIDNEAERRGEREERRRFESYWDGGTTPADALRKQLKDSGRMP